MAEYLALPALSSGVAHTILSASPLHARFEQQNERVASSEMDIGTYAHAMLLEGGADALVVCPFDDWRKNEAKAMRDEARAGGKLPILQGKIAPVEAMVVAAHDYLDASEIAGVFKSGKPEQSIVWRDGQTLCKARPDWLNDEIMLHYKTTTNVNPRAFSRIASNMGYDVALMFYMRGLDAVLPDNNVQHYILAQETAAPYACKLFDLTAARAGVAEIQVERAIKTWQRCVDTGHFPAYDGSIHSIDLQPWELAQAEEDMLTDEELNAGIPA